MAQFLSRCWRTFTSRCYAANWKHSNLWLGRASQHPLSRPNSFRGVEKFFALDVMQTFNNVQLNGWSCSPNTVQLTSRCWRSLSLGWYEAFQKHLNWKLGRVPQTRPIFFTVLMKFFVLMLCSHLKTFKFIAGPRSPTSPVTAQFIPRRSKNVWSWC